MKSRRLTFCVLILLLAGMEAAAQDFPAPATILNTAIQSKIGVYRSSDGGRTWTLIGPVLTGRGVGVSKVLIDPTNSSILYAASSQGIYKSSDRGATWQLTSGSAGDLAIDPSNPSVLYGASGDGIFKSTNGGEDWIGIRTGMTGIVPVSIVVSPSSPQIIYCGTDGYGVFRSRDGGATWQPTRAE
jgi:photosystem II stability/assembly factor-like uncharacterized protein